MTMTSRLILGAPFNGAWKQRNPTMHKTLNLVLYFVLVLFVRIVRFKGVNAY